MFGWKKKAYSGFLASDTQKTLRAVRDLPSEEQQSVAQAVANEIFTAAEEIENTAAPGAQMDEVIRRHLTRAKEFRHEALKRGATNASNPLWAMASLYESWMMAVSGVLDERQSADIQQAIDRWLAEEFEHWKIAR